MKGIFYTFINNSYLIPRCLFFFHNKNCVFFIKIKLKFYSIVNIVVLDVRLNINNLLVWQLKIKKPMPWRRIVSYRINMADIWQPWKNCRYFREIGTKLKRFSSKATIGFWRRLLHLVFVVVVALAFQQAWNGASWISLLMAGKFY